MAIAIILVLVGLFLIYLEFFLPGAIMGIGGALLILASIFLAVLQNLELYLLVSYVIGVIISIFVVAKLALWRIKANKDIYLSIDQEGFQASAFQKDLIGKTGIAATDLKPSGHIYVEDKYLQASSNGGYIDKGYKIQVISGEGSHLIVKIIKEK